MKSNDQGQYDAAVWVLYNSRESESPEPGNQPFSHSDIHKVGYNETDRPAALSGLGQALQSHPHKEFSLRHDSNQRFHTLLKARLSIRLKRATLMTDWVLDTE